MTKTRIHPTRKTALELIAMSRKAVVFSLCASMSFSAGADPTGGRVVDGRAEIGRAGNNTTVINQLTDRVAIDWTSFNVAANERVVFQQPSSSATALNRIFDQNPSQIFGAIDANGRVILLNPNGMLFGENARLNIHSLLATSLNISLEDFKRGNYDLRALADANGGAIVNRGLIQAATGGSVSLVGSKVENSGVILADLGQVNLASGRQAAIDFDGDGMLMFAVDLPDDAAQDSHAPAEVLNTGTIVANGGQVLLSARAARDVIGSVVNNEGVIRARGVENQNGVIRLTGGPGVTTLSSGTLDVSSEQGVGGRVEMTGERVGLMDHAVVDASGELGGGVVHIGGGLQGNDDSLMNAEFSYVSQGASIDASATRRGDGGRVIIWSDDTTRVYGDISVAGGALGGDGGFVETSGKIGLDVANAPNTSAAAGSGGEWLIDPISIDIVQTGDTGFDGADPFTSNSSPATLGVDTILGGLASGNVTIITGGVDATDDGNITWGAGVDLDFDTLGIVDNTLTLQASNNITFDGSIFDSNPGGDLLNLAFITGVTDAGPTQSVTFSGQINLGNTGPGGSFSSDSNTFTSLAGSNIVAPGGTTIDVVDNATLAGSITTDALAVTVSAGAGTAVVDINAAITATSATITTGGADDTITVSQDLPAASLITGGGVDTISVAAGVTLDGAINSGGGSDVINISGTVNGDVSGDADGDDINVLAGGNVLADVLGAGGEDDIDISGAVGGNVLGGTENDIIGLNGVVTGNVNGEGGDDQINVTQTASALAILGGANNDTLFAGDGTLTWDLTGAGAGDVTFDGGPTRSFSQIETVQGGSGADTVNVAAGDTFVGAVNGGDGANTYNIDGIVTGDVTGGANVDDFNVTATGQVNGSLLGGAGNDEFAIEGVVTLDALGGDDNDTFDLSGTISGDLNGNIGDDVFNFLNGGNVGSDVFGGTGDDQFNVAAGATFLTDLNGGDDNDTFTVNGTLSGMALGQGGNDIFNFTAGSTSGLGAEGGAGDDQFTVAGTVNGNLAGDGDADTINVLDGANVTGLVDGGADNDIINASGTNTVAGGIAGGTGDDTITVNAGAAVTADIGGGADGDTLNIDGTVVGNVTGDGGDDTLNLSAAGGATNFDGGTGTNTVFAGDGQNTWVLNGANAGTVSSAPTNVDRTFTNFQIVQGGTGDDDVTLEAGGSAANILGGVGGNDSLTGSNGANTWLIVAAADAAGNTVQGQAFTEFESLLGGSGDDIFDIALNTAFVGDLDGGLGADTFNIAGSLTGDALGGQGADTFNIESTGTVTGNVLAGADDDVINLDGAVSGNASGEGDSDSLVLSATGSAGALLGGDGGTNVDTITAGDGSNDWSVGANGDGNVSIDSGAVTAFQGIEVVQGGIGDDNVILTADSTISLFGGAGAGIDTLTGAGGGNTWDITVASTLVGNEVDGAGFVDFEVLTAGNGGDTFNVASGNTYVGELVGGIGIDMFIIAGVLTGNADGGVGADMFTISGTLDGNAVGGLGNDTVTVDTAGSVTGDVLGGDNNDTITVNATGSVTGDVLGGDNNDTLTIADGASVDGNVLGGLGDDNITLAGTVAQTVDGEGDNDTLNLTATGSALSISGGDGTDSVSAGDGTNVWTVDGDSTGTVGIDGNTPVAFQSVEVIEGGAGADEVTLSVAGSMNDIQGGAGADTLIGADGVNTWDLAAAADADGNSVNVQSFTEFETLVGGAAVDTFTVAGGVNYVGDLQGAGDDDVFNINGVLSGSIDGGAGTANTLTAGSGDNAWVLTGATSGELDSVVGGFTNINDVNGGAGADVFDIEAEFAGNVTGGDGANAFNFVANGNVLGNVTGGAEVDLFLFDSAVEINSASITGGDGADEFTLSSGSVTATLEGGNDADLFTLSSGSTSTSLEGGDGADEFTLNTGAVSATVDGGDGDDVFNLEGAVTVGSVLGQTGNDTLNVAQGGMLGTGQFDGGADTNSLNFTGTTSQSLVLSGAGTLSGYAGSETTATVTFDNVNVFSGGSGDNSVTGPNDNTTWTINGVNAFNADSGTTAVADFTGFARILGGTADDTFVLQAGGMTELNGGAEVLGDTLTTAGLGANFTVDVANQLQLDSVQNVADIEDVSAGDGDDTFTFNADYDGSISSGGGNDVFTVNSVATIMGDLLGGEGDDTYTISGVVIGDLSGEGGVDTFSVATGGDVQGDVLGGANDDVIVVDGNVAGDVLGGLGNDSLTLNGSVAGGLNGEDGDDVVTLTANASVGGVLDGGTGSDTVTSSGTTNEWTTTAQNAGDVVIDGSASAVAFEGFENLLGSDGADTFTLNFGVDGNVDGANGANEFLLNAAINGNLIGGVDVDTVALGAAGSATLIVGGDGSGDDVFTAADADNTWTISSDVSGTNQVGTQDFVGFETLSGGALTDLFTVSSDFDGTLVGAAGSDTFELVADVAVSMIVGGDDADTLSGSNNANNWFVSGTDTGTLNIVTAFEGVENLTGGDQNDAFTLGESGAVTGLLDGGSGGQNILSAANSDNDWTLNSDRGGEIAGVVADFNRIDDVIGGTAVDTFVVEANFVGTVSGGDGDDVFTLLSGGAVGGTLNGDAGVDQINLDGLVADTTLTLTTAGTVDGVNGNSGMALADFQNIDEFVGSASGGDSLVGADAATQWTLSGADSFTVEFDGTSALFMQVSTLTGGSGSDTFTIAGGSLSGLLSGGDGQDTLVGANQDTTWMLDVVTSSVEGFTFADIESLVGGDANDQFLVNGEVVNIEIDGGMGADELVGNDQMNAWTINGSASGELNADATTGDNAVSFDNVETVTGGSDVDEFAINASFAGTLDGAAGDDVFSLSSDPAVTVGALQGGDDDDTLNLEVVSGQRNVEFAGGDGTDTIVLSGALADASETVDVSAGTVQFAESGAAGLSISSTSVETLRDSVTIDNFTIENAAASTATLSDPGQGFTVFDEATGLDVEFDNKDSVFFELPQTDLSTTTDIAVASTLGIEAQSLTTQGMLMANTLQLTNVSLLSMLNIDANFLSMSNVSGMLNIVDDNELDLLNVSATDALIITANTLSVAEDATVMSTGNVTLNSTQELLLSQGSNVSSGGTLTLDADTITQNQSGELSADVINVGSDSGANLVGTNEAGSINVTNMAGNVTINSESATGTNYTVSNNGGSVDINHTGDLDVSSFSNLGANSISDITSTGGITVSGAMTSNQQLSLQAGTDFTQSADITAGSGLNISANTINVLGSASSVATGGDISFESSGNLVTGDLSANQGTINLTSSMGDIFAGANGSTLEADDIVLTGDGAIGTELNPFRVVPRSQAVGNLTLDSTDGRNPSIPIFIEELGEFFTIGARSDSAVSPVARRVLAASAQNQSATIDSGEGVDTSVYEDITLLVVEGRGVTVPCSQAEDPEESCQ